MWSGDIDAARVRLDLTSRPEAARLVRSMSTAVGEALAFDAELLSDVNTAVAEACNNVILHAYGELPGPMSVELEAASGTVEVRIRDRGRGIRRAAQETDGLKVGLALMSAVSDRAEFINVPDGGTEVRLCFGTSGRARTTMPGARHERHELDESGAWRGRLYSGPAGDVVLTVSPVPMLAPVLGHIGRALAPSAGFSLQRCSDVYLLADALGAHAERAAQTTAISVALGAHDHLLEFALSPLQVGASGRLERAGSSETAHPLARLTEGVSISAVDSHETLRVSMRDHLRS
jgi:serine/threonine-protein kinase RsbW